MAEKTLEVGDYKWPESIDFDRYGNLYFTDVVGNALYKFKRQKDGRLERNSTRLLYGLGNASGVSIDRENDFLYVGARVGEKGRIIKIPLLWFKTHSDVNYHLFQADPSSDPALRPEELEIKFTGKRPREAIPNGVVYHRPSNTVFYTDENIFGSILGGRGFIGRPKDSVQTEFQTPNGIDIDSKAENVLVVSLLRKRAIIRWDFQKGQELSRTTVGHWLDGLICLENGDVLVAAFGARRIFHLRRQGDAFIDPCEIARFPGCPTDMAIGPSSDGEGESLFVTTLRGYTFFLGGGRIVEIPHIRELVRSR
jgi:hypothetical protein